MVGNHNNGQNVNQRYVGRSGGIDAMVQSGKSGGCRHGPYGKEQAEMGMKGMGAGNPFHEIREQFPDIISQMVFLLCSDNEHFSSVFIPERLPMQQGTDGFIKMICVELFRGDSSLGKRCDHGQIPMSIQFFQ